MYNHTLTFQTEQQAKRAERALMYTHIDCSNVHVGAQGRLSFQTTHRLEELPRLKLRSDLQATGSTFNVWEALPPYEAGLRAAGRLQQAHGTSFTTFGMPFEFDETFQSGCPHCGYLEDDEEEETTSDIIGDILFFLDQLARFLVGAVLCLVATLLLLFFAIVARIVLFLLEL